MNSIENVYHDSDKERLQQIRDTAAAYFREGLEFDASTGVSTVTMQSGPYAGRVAEMVPATQNPEGHYFRKSDSSPV